ETRETVSCHTGAMVRRARRRLIRGNGVRQGPGGGLPKAALPLGGQQEGGGKMRRRLFGALVMLGPDGAGLPALPEKLPEVRNPLDLPIYQGTQDELNRAAEQTVSDLRGSGYVVGSATISSRHKPFWARPIWQALIQADNDP
ncbi:MAG: hypothetical protein NTZ05_11295, partial [Chloroflexi bacterium]|nr:hypothetical protein [Chloroflexota bacterium]